MLLVVKFGYCHYCRGQPHAAACAVAAQPAAILLWVSALWLSHAAATLQALQKKRAVSSVASTARVKVATTGARPPPLKAFHPAGACLSALVCARMLPLAAS